MTFPSGFENMGNTCYIASALQVITNSRFIKQNLMSNYDTGEYSRAGAVICFLQGKIRQILPRHLKQLMGSKFPRFVGFSQQDGHEFIVQFLEQVNQEQNSVTQRPLYQMLDYQNMSVSQAFHKYSCYQQKFEKSALFDQLQFYIICITACHKCKKNDIHFYTEASLVVDCIDLFSDIPYDDEVSRSEQLKRTTLERCFEIYFRAQQMEQWRCPYCMTVQKALKQKFLYTLPLQLLITFRRFNEGMGKISHIIRFYEKIDLNRFVYDRRVHETFVLNAVSLHSGNCGGGHYTAYVRNEIGQFFYCNDGFVRQIEHINFDDQRAYVLSYSVDRKIEQIQSSCSIPELINQAEFSATPLPGYQSLPLWFDSSPYYGMKRVVNIQQKEEIK